MRQIIAERMAGTAGWIIDRLRPSGLLDQGIKIAKVRYESIGTGQLSVCLRLELTYSGNRDRTPRSLCPGSLRGRWTDPRSRCRRDPQVAALPRPQMEGR
jgi:hypothetical protein